MSPICVSINKNYKCDINKILTSCKGYNIIASRLITFHYVNRKMIPLDLCCKTCFICWSYCWNYYTIRGEQMSSVTKYLMTLNMFSAFCLTEHVFKMLLGSWFSVWKEMVQPFLKELVRAYSNFLVF